MFRWRKLAEQGSLSAVHADESVVPLSQVQVLEQQVPQLQRLLGKKTRSAKFCVRPRSRPSKKVAIALAMIVGGHRVATVCRVLGVARSNANRATIAGIDGA